MLRDLQWNIDFEYSSTVEGLGTFMQSLPLHLKELLATEVHKELFQQFKFFKVEEGAEKSFITWVSHRLLPRIYFSSQYLYKEKDELTGVFCIKSGSLAFVLVEYRNAIYLKKASGSIIGYEDYLMPMLVNNESETKFDASITRQFTARAIAQIQALELPSTDLLLIIEEFPGAYEILYLESEDNLKKLLENKDRISKRLAKKDQKPFESFEYNNSARRHSEQESMPRSINDPFRESQGSAPRTSARRKTRPLD